ncbi:MAG UNVERIFIED_CONTAM: hypothetical protein LVR18_47400 [Planctomycetaceae bacterium]
MQGLSVRLPDVSISRIPDLARELKNCADRRQAASSRPSQKTVPRTATNDSPPLPPLLAAKPHCSKLPAKTAPPKPTSPAARQTAAGRTACRKPS